MSTFQTPQPITAVVEVVAGTVRLTATDRDDTVVDVQPSDPNRPSDVRIAEQTRVDFNNGTLKVTAGRRFIQLGRGGAVDIHIGLPSGSRLDASSVSADVHVDGSLADCKLATAGGDMVMDFVTGSVKADSASGDIEVTNLLGSASISTASGDTRIGELHGNLLFQAASGSLVVGELRGDAKSRTASGSVTVDRAVSGAVSTQSSSGDIRVDIATGTAAQLNLKTRSGTVSNGLEAADGPADGDETLLVHVRTGSGDIAVRRSTAGLTLR
jgi:DUF4097 and DUF4098 domain-containing protein YvlB